MKEPRQFTREEVERLVPEDNGLIQAWIGSHIPDHRKMAITLLQTRLDIEQARKDRDELLEISRRFHDGHEDHYNGDGCSTDDELSRIEQSKK